MLARGDKVVLKVNRKGDFEVSGHVFRKGKMDLAVSVSSDGRLVKTGLWDGSAYKDVELPDVWELELEAKRFADMLDSIADDFFYIDFEAFAREVRSTPEVAGLLEKLGSPKAFSDVM